LVLRRPVSARPARTYDPLLWQYIWLYCHAYIWYNSSVKVGTVIENEKWKIKVFAPPKEHGPAHVHIVAKGERAQVKISFMTLEVIGTTQFSKKAVKKIIRYVHENYEYLW